MYNAILFVLILQINLVNLVYIYVSQMTFFSISLKSILKPENNKRCERLISFSLHSTMMQSVIASLAILSMR